MVFFVLFPSQFLAAQKVLYSPLFDGNSAVRHYQMAGKVASTYWVIREGKIPYGSRPSERNPGRDSIKPSHVARLFEFAAGSEEKEFQLSYNRLVVEVSSTLRNI